MRAVEQHIEIKPGYHKTKLGVLPMDWDTPDLGEVTKINQGLQIAIADRFTEPVDGALFYITNEFLKEGSHYKYYIVNPPKNVVCTKEDILMTRTGNTGQVVTGVVGAFHNNFFKIKFDEERIDRRYMVYFLRSNHTQYTIMKLAGTSTIPDLNHSDFYRIRIPLPPLPEQQKIAKILSTWDTAIEKQQALIDEKQHLKKGLMQQLLTGKKRFPGFTEEWKEKPFGDVFKFISTISYSRENLMYGAQGIKYIHYGDIHSTYGNIILNVRNEEQIPILLENVSFPNKIEYLEEGDLVIADASEDYDGVAACVELFNVGDDKVIGGLHTFVARDDSGLTVAGCRGYLLKHVDVLREMRRIATGSKVYGISKTNINKVVLKLPTIEEQQKIASVLSAADEEIQKLQQELDELKEQKRGLMQKLLTGEVRVKV